MTRTLRELGVLFIYDFQVNCKGEMSVPWSPRSFSVLNRFH